MEPTTKSCAFEYPSFEDVRTQIRLLHIQPGARESSLVCSLLVYSLPEKGSDHISRSNVTAYRAISYTWGGQRPSESIILNGTQMLVTRNCWEALWQARLHEAVARTNKHALPGSESIPIFIDAICINQNDVQEKTAQVQMMARIFDNALETLIAPGWEGDGSEFFVKGMESLAALIVDVSTGGELVCLPDAILPTSVQMVWCAEDVDQELIRYIDLRFNTYKTRDHRSKILNKFLNSYEPKVAASWFSYFWSFANRPYWSRVWIIPETTTRRHRRVMCGSKILKYEMVEIVAALLEHTKHDMLGNRDWEQPFHDATGMRASEFALAIQECGMWNSLLRASKGRTGSSKLTHEAFSGSSQYGKGNHWQMELLGCREPRDRIYCMLAQFLWRGCTGGLVTSYEIPSIEVAFNTVRYLHGNELRSPFKVMAKLIRWLELDKDDSLRCQALGRALNNDTENASRSMSASALCHINACTEGHVSSENSAPLSLAGYCPVFKSRNGKLAIFAERIHRMLLNTTGQHDLLASQEKNTIEIHYQQPNGESAWFDHEIAIPLEEGDLIAEIDVDIGTNQLGLPSLTMVGSPESWTSHRSMAEPDVAAHREASESDILAITSEAWVFRRSSARTYEIVACGQLFGVAGEFVELYCRSNVVSAIEKVCGDLTEVQRAICDDADELSLALHLDPKDTLAYMAVLSGVQSSDPGSCKELLRYLENERSFCRARFSSFATLRPRGEDVDDNMKVCIHCGKDLRIIAKSTAGELIVNAKTKRKAEEDSDKSIKRRKDELNEA